MKSTYSYFGNNEAFTRAYLADRLRRRRGRAERCASCCAQGLPRAARRQAPAGRRRREPGRLAHWRCGVFGDPGPRLDALAEEVQRRLVARRRAHGRRRGRRARARTRSRWWWPATAPRATGSPPATSARAVALFFRGRPLARFRGPEGEVEVQARLAEADRTSLEQLRAACRSPATRRARSVPLAAVAEFRTVETPPSIERQQRRSVADGRRQLDSQASAARSARRSARELERDELPDRLLVVVRLRRSRRRTRPSRRCCVNLVLALMLVYLVMAALFESLLHPFAIMFALPFAFVGHRVDLLPHRLAVQPDGADRAPDPGRDRGEQRHRAGLQGPPAARAAACRAPRRCSRPARDRLRPILMTTATTVLGPPAAGDRRQPRRRHPLLSRSRAR